MIHKSTILILLSLFTIAAVVANMEKVKEYKSQANFKEPNGRTLKLLKVNAGGGEYSFDGQKIAYHSKGADGFYDLYISDSNGLNEKCLTCSSSLFSGRHVGNGSWHPNGQYIIFQAEKENYFKHPATHSLTTPGMGWHNDIWVTNITGTNFWGITNLPTKQKLLDPTPLEAVLNAHFSPDGKKVSWGQTTKNTLSGWEGWELMIGDITFNQGIPQVSSLTPHQPRNLNAYYESDDFNNSTTSLTISANLEPKQKGLGMDIYTYDIFTKTLKRLTWTLKDWDEGAVYSPDNKKIAWLSSTGYDFSTDTTNEYWWQTGKSDFWLMNANGTGKRQITFFNKPGTFDYSLVNGKRVMAAYNEWQKGTNKLLLSITVDHGRGNLEDRLYELKLNFF